MSGSLCALEHGRTTTSIELPWVYDGVSVFEHPDGTLCNRWRGAAERASEREDSRDRSILRERERLTDEWIARHARQDDRAVGEPGTEPCS